MSKTYNVNREVNDAFYRYKMPAIVAKVEGQGNGIKTVIVNMVDIARALNREAIYPTKYFGIELGAQTQIDKKNERFIVNGSHDAEKMQDILDGYIKKFVLCQKCENPETKLTVHRDDILQTCMACGNKDKLRNMGHGLANFIVRQHKNQKIESKRNKKKDAESKSTTKDIYQGERADDSKKNVETKVNGAKKDEWEGDEWVDSDSDDELDKEMAKVALRDMKPNAMTGEQKGQAFEEFLQELIDEEKLEGMMKFKEQILQIVLKAEYYQIKQKTPFVLFEKLILPSEEFAKNMKKYRGLFVYMNRETGTEEVDLKAMKYTLNAFETYFEKYPNLVDKCAIFLKFMYDLDVLDEAAIVEWGDSKPSKKFVAKELSAALKEKSKKLVEWLKTADTESEDESDSDDEGPEFTDEKPVGIVKVEESGTNGKVASEDEVDDEDIDDI